MSPELREFVLSLPVEVRKELCRVKCDACYAVWTANTGWDFLRMTPDQAPLYASAVEAPSATVMAVVPVSPLAIALHAAKLLGADEASLTVDFGGGGYTYAVATSQPVDGGSVPYQFADVQNDPTGHRAAIALLQKVMDERKVPNAEP